MRSLLFYLLIVMSGYLHAFCDGFMSAVGSCASSPAESVGKQCDWYLETQTPAADDWYIDYIEDDSNAYGTAYKYKCSTFIWDSTRPTGKRIQGSDSGRAVFSSCRGNATSTETSSSCFVECDVPLVGGLCPKDEENTCKNGQGSGPINFLTGNKLFTEVDYETNGINRLHFTRYYNSQNNRVRRSAGGWVSPEKDTTFFETNGPFVSSTNNINDLENSGNPFKHIVYKTININDGSPNGIDMVLPVQEKLAAPMKRITSVWRNNFDLSLVRSFHDLTSLSLVRENGNEYKFIRNNTNESVYTPDRVDNRGVEQVIAHANGFIYVKENLDKEHYGLNGELMAIEAKNGYLQTLTYDENGSLIEVADSEGRSLIFTHDLEGRIETITTPEGYEYRYLYVGLTDLVDSVYYPDSDSEPLNNPYRRYVYEDARFPNAVTGIYENTQRYGTYHYGEDGKAIYSGLANGAQAYSVNFDVAGQTTVTNALGKNTVYHYDTSNNLVQIDGEPSANCLGDSRQFTYDSNNFKTSATDKNGNMTTYVRDSNGREIIRTEAFGTPQARTIETEWHTSLNVKTKVTEPERITHYSYDVNGLLINQIVAPVVHAVP